jgi:hypothetical protein
LEVIEMPNVALLSSEDLLLSSINDIFELLQARLAKDAPLDELELFLSDAFTRIQFRGDQSRIVF